MKPVTAKGQPKGQVYKEHGRWIWLRPNMGKETFGPRLTLADVRDTVARVCRVNLDEVEIGQ